MALAGTAAAAAELFKDAAAVPHRNRTLAYARAMDALQRQFPRDSEAKIFYALAVNQPRARHPKIVRGATQLCVWREHR